MNGLTIAALAATALIAVVDWYAVHTANQRLEDVAKPLTMVALIVAALALDPVDGTARAWFVAALVLSMLGDIFLLRSETRFVPGLASFLLGHLAYVVGLRMLGTSAAGLIVAIVIVLLAMPTIALPVVRAVRRGSEPELLGPVAAYIVVISAMVLAAGGTGIAIALIGALFFYASDALIAWNRFVQPLAWGRIAIIVTYHVGQVGLVLSLV